MRDLFRCGRLEGIGDRTTDLLEVPSQSGGRDNEADRRLVCDIAVRVQDIPGYAHVVAGLRIAPLQAAFFLDQHLLRAGDDEEILCVAPPWRCNGTPEPAGMTPRITQNSSDQLRNSTVAPRTSKV